MMCCWKSCIVESDVKIIGGTSTFKLSPICSCLQITAISVIECVRMKTAVGKEVNGPIFFA